MKLLLVDDEIKLLEALSYTLKKKGYVTDTATDGDTGLELAMSGIYDIIILDRMLPGLSGMDILQTIRKHSVNTPVLFLTARDSSEDRVAGLDAGATITWLSRFPRKNFWPG